MIIDLLLVVVIIGIGYSLFQIVPRVADYVKGRREYSSMASSYVTENDVLDETETETLPEEDSKTSEIPITVDFDRLISVNPETVGWIYCKDTVINYPVMKADNNDKYLHRLPDGTYNFAGSIFMDRDCDPHLGDFCTLLYGHSMNDGSMFATLLKYADPAFYKEHPVMWYLTPDYAYRLDLYAGYVTDPSDKVYKLFADMEEFDEFISSSARRSAWKPDAEFPEDIDRVFVLSTCAYVRSNSRFIVLAVPERIEY